mgnify:CR=1 FL=1
MKTYKIAVIPGDGVGPEVLKEGMKVLKQAAECSGAFSFEDTWFPWGCGYYLEHGQMMPGDGIRILEGFDAIYLGAVGDPSVPSGVLERGLLTAAELDDIFSAQNLMHPAYKAKRYTDESEK